jgi:hypothetical protein
VVNHTVGAGSRMSADLQQICPAQSLLSWQLLAHLVLQRPSQQISSLSLLQSIELKQRLGHLLAYRQRPSTAKAGSTVAAVWQHISPLPVLQSALCEQDAGHKRGGRQTRSL